MSSLEKTANRIMDLNEMFKAQGVNHVPTFPLSDPAHIYHDHWFLALMAIVAGGKLEVDSLGSLGVDGRFFLTCHSVERAHEWITMIEMLRSTWRDA